MDLGMAGQAGEGWVLPRGAAVGLDGSTRLGWAGPVRLIIISSRLISRRSDRGPGPSPGSAVFV